MRTSAEMKSSVDSNNFNVSMCVTVHPDIRAVEQGGVGVSLVCHGGVVGWAYYHVSQFQKY